MTRRRSIGFRLTVWYSVILAVALVTFGVSMWFALRQSLYRAVDATLRDRARDVGAILEQYGGRFPPEKMAEELQERLEGGPGGDLIRVADSQGKWLYLHRALDDARLPAPTADQLKSGSRYEDVQARGQALRLLSMSVASRGRVYVVQTAIPLHELREGLEGFEFIFPAIPVVLGLASLGGCWMSRRALSPVDEITNAARSISAQNLSHRLPVPQTGDALQRLSSTLNEMFGRLDAAFGRVTRFTADASHELRTPIAFMRTTAELALRKQRSEADYRDALARILSELERTSGLVEDLLLLARADSASGMRFERINLTETVQDACEQGSVLAEEKQVAFDWHAPDPLIEMRGDSPALRRVLLCLIDNAVKYTNAGGQVRVNLKRIETSVRIEVSDSGIGIAEEDLPHIFDRFYRADKARSHGTGGAGLGLAIAQWIVEAHQGELRVQSQLGRGSQFEIVLPI
jgi:heavy metal sensor kinase